MTPLTHAEKRVARYLLSTMTYVDIGRILQIEKNTVKTHAKNIYRKLGATAGRNQVRTDAQMKRICNGEDPNVKDKDGNQGKCGATFDDVYQRTICPHVPFGEPLQRTVEPPYPLPVVPRPRPDLEHHHHPLSIHGCTADHAADPADVHAYAVMYTSPHPAMWLTMSIDAAKTFAGRAGGVVVALPIVFDYREVVTDEAELMARGMVAEGVPAGAAAVIATNFYGRLEDATALAMRLRVDALPTVPQLPVDEAAKPAPGCEGARKLNPGDRCADPRCARCWPGFMPDTA